MPYAIGLKLWTTDSESVFKSLLLCVSAEDAARGREGGGEVERGPLIADQQDPRLHGLEHRGARGHQGTRTRWSMKVAVVEVSALPQKRSCKYQVHIRTHVVSATLLVHCTTLQYQRTVLRNWLLITLLQMRFAMARLRSSR